MTALREHEEQFAEVLRAGAWRHLDAGEALARALNPYPVERANLETRGAWLAAHRYDAPVWVRTSVGSFQRKYHPSYDCPSLIRPETFIVMLEGHAIAAERRTACRKDACQEVAAEWARRYPEAAAAAV